MNTQSKLNRRVLILFFPILILLFTSLASWSHPQQQSLAYWCDISFENLNQNKSDAIYYFNQNQIEKSIEILIGGVDQSITDLKPWPNSITATAALRIKNTYNFLVKRTPPLKNQNSKLVNVNFYYFLLKSYEFLETVRYQYDTRVDTSPYSFYNSGSSAQSLDNNRKNKKLQKDYGLPYNPKPKLTTQTQDSEIRQRHYGKSFSDQFNSRYYYPWDYNFNTSINFAFAQIRQVLEKYMIQKDRILYTTGPELMFLYLLEINAYYALNDLRMATSPQYACPIVKLQSIRRQIYQFYNQNKRNPQNDVGLRQRAQLLVNRVYPIALSIANWTTGQACYTNYSNYDHQQQKQHRQHYEEPRHHNHRR